ncbi:MAG: amino acid permease [Clostridiales Family XIII bacterium]|jgi:lysine-specific permease|nr:amino acid permease [Clostridiales Family XIII bacterium]
MSSQEHAGQLKRGIGQRQLSMIAIGGAIGTGLFLASGATIHDAGPGGAVLCYAIIGIIVYLMMTSLGEMATKLPLPGGFQTFATRFVDPAAGMMFGWNYWISWAITLAAEFAASAILMTFWFPDVPSWIWSLIFFVILLALNLFNVKGYAEAEFWFASVKVIAVVLFIIIGVLVICGVGGSHSTGFSNWVLEATDADGNPAKAPFIGGFSAFLSVFLVAGFSFQGTEGVGIAAAEAKDPEKSIPKAIKTVFWRIMIFYVLAISVIATLIPFNDPRLLGGSEEDVTMSPFVILFKMIDIPYAAGIVNFVILTSVLSAGNSSLYMASRMLYSMGRQKQAPKILGRTTSRGVPAIAVCATAAVGALAMFSTLVGLDAIYAFFYNASSVTGFIIWLGISITHLRFRQAWKAQGHSVSELKYKSKFFPFGPILAALVFLVIIIGNVWVMIPKAGAGTEDIIGFAGTFGIIPILLLIFVGYKIIHKTKMVPLKEADFTMPAEHAYDSAE